jgi:hypothetical protein
MRQCPSSVELTFDTGEWYSLAQCIAFPPHVCCSTLLPIPPGFDASNLNDYEMNLFVSAAPRGDERARMITLIIDSESSRVLSVGEVVEMVVYDRILPAGRSFTGPLHLESDDWTPSPCCISTSPNATVSSLSSSIMEEIRVTPATHEQMIRDYSIAGRVPGWYFRMREKSYSVWDVEGRDIYGKQVARLGVVDEQRALEECIEYACKISDAEKWASPWPVNACFQFTPARSIHCTPSSALNVMPDCVNDVFTTDESTPTTVQPVMADEPARTLVN